jgi:hypothetical protein
MPKFLVRWEVEVEADSPEEAVHNARVAQLDPYPHNHEFEVVVDGKGQFHPLSSIKYCYQCDKPTSYLFDDGRCSKCTRLTPEEVRGE